MVRHLLYTQSNIKTMSSFKITLQQFQQNRVHDKITNGNYTFVMVVINMVIVSKKCSCHDVFKNLTKFSHAFASKFPVNLDEVGYAYLFFPHQVDFRFSPHFRPMLCGSKISNGGSVVVTYAPAGALDFLLRFLTRLGRASSSSRYSGSGAGFGVVRRFRLLLTGGRVGGRVGGLVGSTSS